MIDLQRTYRPSNDIVVREIENEIIIVPLTSGIADMEDELFTLNETARAIWERLDGQKSLQRIIDELSMEYNANKEQIAADVVELTEELLKKKDVDCRLLTIPRSTPVTGHGKNESWPFSVDIIC